MTPADAGMRIAMVCLGASPLGPPDGHGGTGQGTRVDALSRVMAARGHEVVVYSRRDRQDLPARVQLAPGVRVEHVEAGPRRPLTEDELLEVLPRFSSELAHAWLQRPPDVAHAHSWESGVATVRSAAAVGIPVTISFHSLGHVEQSPAAGSGSSPRLDAERSLARYVHRAIATSQAEVDELVRLGAAHDRVVVVPPGVDTTHFSPIGEEAPRRTWRHRVLWVGDLGPESGVEDAVRMVSHVPVCELVIAGGPPRSGLSEDADVARVRLLARTLDVEDRVEFVGAVSRSDEPALIRSADVVVCLPHSGMVPAALLEAMACGRPVVVTGVGALLETVEDGVTGLVVEPGSPNSAGMAVRRLLSAPGLRAAMGDEARREAEQTYGWRQVAESVERVYQSARAALRPSSVRLAPLALSEGLAFAPFSDPTQGWAPARGSRTG